ncbi:MAG: hypothetical protein JNK63_09670 [Chthonomonas sp.]|nr:hypothetical protein [Chthonomonas sp.]
MRIALPVLAVVALSGCRQTSSMTEVRENGTFSRSVKFAAIDVDETSKLKIDDVFVIPKGNGWTSVPQTAGSATGGTTIEMRNAFPFGQEVTDLGLKLKGKIVLVNKVKVTEPTPGNYEYRETFTWSGDAPKEDRSEKLAELVEDFFKGNDKVTKAQKDEFAKEGEARLLTFIFGPPEPHLSLALSSPEFFIRKARATLGPKLIEAAERIFGDALDLAGRRKLVAHIMDPDFAAENAPAPADPTTEEESDDQPTTLTMVVKMPGTITETNGLIDPISGEVYWTMHREAAERGEVTIFAKSKK